MRVLTYKERGQEVFLDRYALRDKEGNLIEKTVEESCDRIARFVSSKETKKEHWRKKFYDIMTSMRFIPAGRIWSNAATKNDLFFNCWFVNVEDSRESIFQSLKEAIELSSLGGGIGFNFSSLRPKGAAVRGVGGTSSGVCSFIDIYNTALGVVKQGGSRRAASIAILDISHPEILDFIRAKRDENRWTNFNISVNITNDFIEAVREDKDWIFKFKDKEYDKIKAKKLWDELVESMWLKGEPGILSLDNINYWGNSSVLGYKILGTNPCGELPSESKNSCCLGSINLITHYENGEFNFEKFKETISIAVRFLDNILDLNNYPFKDYEKIGRDLRRIGLGIMGLADLFYLMKIKYGSKESLEFTEKMLICLRDTAYQTSIDLAEERGSFPALDANKLLKSNYIKTLPKEIQDGIKKIGLRNINLLSQPPTGTTSQVAGVSSGHEPVYQLEYTRKDRIGEVRLIDPFYLAWQKENPDAEKPDYFVTTHDLTSKEHLDIHLLFTKYIDNSVSKCVGKGTLIYTNKGTLPIEKLTDEHNLMPDSFHKPLENLYIIDGDGKQRKVTSHYYGGRKPTVIIKFNNGASYELSTNHNIMTYDGWKKAGEITQKDLVLCRKYENLFKVDGEVKLPDINKNDFKTNSNKDFEIPSKMSTNFSKWIGMFIADGCLIESTGEISLCEKNDVVGDLFDSLSFDVFGLIPKKIVDKRNGVINHSITSRNIVRWLKSQIGYRSYDKHIPDSILCGNEREQLAFLSGITLDGYAKGRNKRGVKKKATKLVIYEGRSEELVKQIYSITKSLGFNPRMHSKNVSGYNYKTYGVSVDSPITCIEYHKNDIVYKQLSYYHPIKINYKAIKLNKIVGAYHPQYSALRDMKRRDANYASTSVLKSLGISFDEDVYIIKPVDIKFSENDVYDIEVEESHTYLIDGIISHNTINFPHKATQKEMSKFLFDALPHLKGITVYRDGSRTEQVLSTNGKSKPKKEELKRLEVAKRLPAVSLERETAECGTIHLNVAQTLEGCPVKTFINIAKPGACVNSLLDGLARVCSLAVQYQVPIIEIADKLRDIKCGKPKLYPKSETCFSCVDGVARMIEELLEEKLEIKKAGEERCPNCGSIEIEKAAEGDDACLKCLRCGYKSCSPV